MGKILSKSLMFIVNNLPAIIFIGMFGIMVFREVLL
jgi:hypothetical protein